MKRFLLMTVVALSTLGLSSHWHPKFDPEKFDAEMEQFITTEAALSAQEAAKFFPIYKEMQSRQRALFHKRWRYRHVDLSDDKACADAIRERDEQDVQIKLLQQEYHQKFCNMLPASKVLRIIRAEEKFHRQAFRRVAKRN